MPSRRSAAAWRPVPPPPPRSLIAPRALITRCQGTAFPSTRQSSGSARSAQPTVRAPRCRPIMKAIWPYVATRPRGTCATVRHTFRNIGSSVIAVGRPVVHVAGTACMLAYAAMADSGRDGSLTDVPGFRVGHATDARGLTGCTVILCGDGAVPGIDVSGMATGLRDPGPCDPCHLVPAVHALFLSGGSAYGLDAAAGVMSFLEERRVGFRLREAIVPIVPAAILFDLSVGDPRSRPGPAMARRACRNASSGPVLQGNVGAGTGATVGKLHGVARAMKTGLGSASTRRGALVVGALAVVNAWGDVTDPKTGRIVAGLRDSPLGARRIGMAAALVDGALDPFARRGRPGSAHAARLPASTTLGVV